MATQRQKRLAKKIVENVSLDVPLNAGELLESAGYSPVTAQATPGRVISQKGVQEELENLGFTEYNAKKVVADIMLDPDTDKNTKLKAADMTLKVHGSYAPTKTDVTTQGESLNRGGADILEIANKAAELLKEQKT